MASKSGFGKVTQKELNEKFDGLKTILQNIKSKSSGKDLYMHLKEVFRTLILHYPDQALEKIEEVSESAVAVLEKWQIPDAEEKVRQYATIQIPQQIGESFNPFDFLKTAFIINNSRMRSSWLPWFRRGRKYATS